MDSIIIREMKKSDLIHVVRIENEAFTLPFSRALFGKFMALDSCHNWVAVSGGKIVGYIIYSLVVNEVDLYNIAVDEKWRKRGVATKMMDSLLDHLKGEGGGTIFLEVRPSNREARAFYDRFGFVQVGVRRGYYHDSGEDALVYARGV